MYETNLFECKGTKDILLIDRATNVGRKVHIKLYNHDRSN